MHVRIDGEFVNGDEFDLLVVRYKIKIIIFITLIYNLNI